MLIDFEPSLTYFTNQLKTPSCFKWRLLHVVSEYFELVARVFLRCQGIIVMMITVTGGLIRIIMTMTTFRGIPVTQTHPTNQKLPLIVTGITKKRIFQNDGLISGDLLRNGMMTSLTMRKTHPKGPGKIAPRTVIMVERMAILVIDPRIVLT
ncbi:hypothetical protein ECG_04068 [Echinococcus granulosus]|nr:hypothetical protein ECG_04068 [Echinococcus granulosus]